MIFFKRISLSLSLSIFVKTKITFCLSCFNLSRIKLSPLPNPSLMSTRKRTKSTLVVME